MSDPLTIQNSAEEKYTFQHITDKDRHEVESKILESLEEETGERVINLDHRRPLKESKIGEMDAAMVVMGLEDKYGVTIEAPDLVEIGERDLGPNGFLGLFFGRKEKIYEGDSYGEPASYCRLSFKDLVRKTLIHLDKQRL